MAGYEVNVGKDLLPGLLSGQDGLAKLVEVVLTPLRDGAGPLGCWSTFEIIRRGAHANPSQTRSHKKRSQGSGQVHGQHVFKGFPRFL
jgi:hypothetical protein